MEAVIIKHNFTAGLTLKEALNAFFETHDPETTQVFFWKFFQCWVTRDCKIKADVTDEEVALFFDQLIDIVDAAYSTYQTNGAAVEKRKGDGNNE